MSFFDNVWVQDIFSGLISGVISGMIVSAYYRHKDNVADNLRLYWNIKQYILNFRSQHNDYKNLINDQTYIDNIEKLVCSLQFPRPFTKKDIKNRNEKKIVDTYIIKFAKIEEILARCKSQNSQKDRMSLQSAVEEFLGYAEITKLKTYI